MINFKQGDVLVRKFGTDPKDTHKQVMFIAQLDSEPTVFIGKSLQTGDYLKFLCCGWVKKPQKVKRWIGVSPSGFCTNHYATKAEVIREEGEYQFIEIEVEM